MEFPHPLPDPQELTSHTLHALATLAGQAATPPHPEGSLRAEGTSALVGLEEDAKGPSEPGGRRQRRLVASPRDSSDHGPPFLQATALSLRSSPLSRPLPGNTLWEPANSSSVAARPAGQLQAALIH